MLVARLESLRGLKKVKLVAWKALPNERPWKGEWVEGSILEAPFEMGFFTPEAEQDCHKHPKAYEIYIFCGRGEVSNGVERRGVKEGDVVIFLPDERHLIKLDYGFGYSLLIGEPLKVKLAREECEGGR